MEQRIRLVRSELVAEDTIAFFFEKPESFQHEPGQSSFLTLVEPPETDEQGDARMLTIASAPHERELMFATRIRDTAFKRTLERAAPGALATLDGPSGEMLLHEDSARPAVFLAGGIGITPFLAMARHAAHARLSHRIYLFYANRRPEDAAFLAELKMLEQENPLFRLVATMTKPLPSWPGETGYINAPMIERYVEDLIAPIYYIAGPPVMTAAMREMLAQCGLGDESIRGEDFFGY